NFLRNLVKFILAGCLFLPFAAIVSTHAAQFNASDIETDCIDGVNGPGGLTVTVCDPFFIVAYIQVDPKKQIRHKN
ncbi:hypothetical protein ACFL17_07055, partial [Pseudomonadota bacterium]